MVIDFSHQQPQSLFRVSLVFQDFFENQHFTEYGCGFAQYERGVEFKYTDPLPGKILMKAMPDFMGDSHDVAHGAGVIHQNIGVELRNGLAAKTASHSGAPPLYSASI